MSAGRRRILPRPLDKVRQQQQDLQALPSCLPSDFGRFEYLNELLSISAGETELRLNVGYVILNSADDELSLRVGPVKGLCYWGSRECQYGAMNSFELS